MTDGLTKNKNLVPILDKALERAPQEFWLRDGVHPALAGHQLLADAWIEATKELLHGSR